MFVCSVDHQRLQQQKHLTQSVSSSEFTKSVCSKLRIWREISLTMLQRLLLRPHQQDVYKMTILRLRHPSADFKSHLVATEYFREVADHSHGAFPEMRAASGGLHSVSSTFHRSCAQAVLEGSELPAEITPNNSHVLICFGEEITHLGLVRHRHIVHNVGEQLRGQVTSGATQIWKRALKPAHQSGKMKWSTWVTMLPPCNQAFQASHVVLDMNNDAHPRLDAINGHQLENLNAHLYGANVGRQQ